MPIKYPPPIIGLPDSINKVKVFEKLYAFFALTSLNDPIQSLQYIGGGSNHCLKLTLKSPELNQQSFLIRLPGAQSEVLVDRRSERANSNQIRNLGVCPTLHSECLDPEDILLRKGYKVEAFLENATSLDPTTFSAHQIEALAQLKKVHQSEQVFETEYNILDRIKKMCYTLKVNIESIEELQLTDVLNTIESKVLELEQQALCFGKTPSVPCHNDISPYNFMKIPNINGGFDIKIIDWEFSGMNDPMVELAYIASENKYSSMDKIERLLNDYHADEIITEEMFKAELDRIVFYIPVVNLKVAIWNLMQVAMHNETRPTEDLKIWFFRWYHSFLESTQAHHYKKLIDQLLLSPREREASRASFFHHAPLRLASRAEARDAPRSNSPTSNS